MIDEATRARWSKLFAGATRGPWLHSREPYERVHTTTGDLIAVPTNVMGGRPGDAEDMQFCAEAREGWPRALAALDASEAECRALRDLSETQTASASMELHRVQEELDRHTAAISEARSLAGQVSASHDLLRASYEALLAETRPLIALAGAVERWAKHRNPDSLRTAWDAYLAARPGPA